MIFNLEKIRFIYYYLIIWAIPLLPMECQQILGLMVKE